MPKTLTHTHWDWTREVEELAKGVLRVTTAGHGGLKLSRERWEELPAAVRNTMLTPLYAEEDCEESIVRILLGVGDGRDKETALNKGPMEVIQCRKALQICMGKEKRI